MTTIKTKTFEEIEKEVTPRRLYNRQCNTLLISMEARKSKSYCFDLSVVRSEGWKGRVRD